MREIKFKGKRIDNGRWIEGSPYELSDGTVWIIAPMALGFDLGPEPNEEDCEKPFWFEVDPETVGQFVCGKLYEGDIARVWDQNNCYVDEEGESVIHDDDVTICTVRWGGADYPAFDFMYKSKTIVNKKGWYWCNFSDEYNSFSNPDIDCEIIGNIHDNGDLI